MPRTLLIAIGGNSLIRAHEDPTVGTERARVAETCHAIARLAAEGWRVVVTHGNGPQVGAALLRSERAAADTYPLPLDVCVATTQGEIGFLLEQALDGALAMRGLPQPVATVLAQVVVARSDPGFTRPTKPIGPFYSRAEADARRLSGWTLVEEPSPGPRRFRRVVPSPEPLEIVEEPAIRALIDAGVIVITLGGGGIPVMRDGWQLTGVDAVVDKDLASALLAIRLRVDVFLIATDVDRVYVDFGRPQARGLVDVTAEELRRYAAAGHFPAGTMGPKVEAVLRFLAAGGDEAIVTAPEHLYAALGGTAGTHVFSDSRAAAQLAGIVGPVAAHAAAGRGSS